MDVSSQKKEIENLKLEIAEIRAEFRDIERTCRSLQKKYKDVGASLKNNSKFVAKTAKTLTRNKYGKNSELFGALAEIGVNFAGDIVENVGNKIVEKKRAKALEETADARTEMFDTKMGFLEKTILVINNRIEKVKNSLINEARINKDDIPREIFSDILKQFYQIFYLYYQLIYIRYELYWYRGELPYMLFGDKSKRTSINSKSNIFHDCVEGLIDWSGFNDNFSDKKPFSFRVDTIGKTAIASDEILNSIANNLPDFSHNIKSIENLNIEDLSFEEKKDYHAYYEDNLFLKMRINEIEIEKRKLEIEARRPRERSIIILCNILTVTLVVFVYKYFVPQYLLATTISFGILVFRLFIYRAKKIENDPLTLKHEKLQKEIWSKLSIVRDKINNDGLDAIYT